MAETPAQRRHRHEQEAVALEEEFATIAVETMDLDVRNAGAAILAQFLRGVRGKSLASIIKRQFKAVRPRIRKKIQDLDLLDRAVTLGLHHGRELAAEAVPPTEFKDPAINVALAGLDKRAREHLDASIDLAASLPLNDRASVVSVLARSYKAVRETEADARWIAERAVSAGVAAAAKSVGANVMWVAERDGCLACLAYAGQIVEPGEEFPHNLTYGDTPIEPYEQLWFPPLHPNCRCQIELTYEDVGQDDSLVREAQRSVAQGKAPASEPAQRRAADRLLSGPNMLPKTVIKRSKIKFDLDGGEPIPPYVPRPKKDD